ncbi:MAG: glycosyltransferase family 4 protein [Thermoplasmata archaeon]|nr:glycosyltransferase family 4 protein [Thermoplasmata archaeon]
MRIAEVSTRYPPGPGGVERHVFELSHRLAARGDDVRVFSSDLYREFPWERFPASVPRRSNESGVRVERLRVVSLPGEMHYPFFLGLGAALRRAEPDVVHVHTYGTHHVAVARRYGRRTKTPFVLTTHFHPIWSIEGGAARHRLRGFYDRRLAAPIVANAARVIVQTREEERLLREVLPTLPPVVRIPPGHTPLPPPVPEETMRRVLGLDGPYVLFVGRLASNKGLEGLVDAFVPLASHDPTASLVLIGEDGGMRDRVERRIRERGLAGRVQRTGHVEDEALLASAFRSAQLVVLPSDYEAFGLVLLEALGHGRCVIASRVGGIPEVLDGGKAGCLVPPHDVPALSEALLRLWDSEVERVRLGAYGRTEVVPRYSWDRVAAEIQQLFQTVVDHP